ncbi:thioredoxin family protein [Gangjinia marincola]|uniref:Thioredoxin family protein n=1 Tax=Gangjinia marincola TaxID=578463 RepID=A0ABP3XWZ6_9FLAO
MKHQNEIIKDSLSNAMSYIEYRALIKHLITKEKSTGNEQSEALLHYSTLNDRRMNRWDKTLKLSAEAEEFFTSIQEPLTWLVISEGWCGDAAHVLPVLHTIAESSPAIDLKIVLRDKHPELMDHFLTNGSRSIAKLIILDDQEQVLDTYGPRPSTATQMVSAQKREFGELTPDFKEVLQLWYNKDKGQTIVNDLLKLHQDLNV